MDIYSGFTPIEHGDFPSFFVNVYQAGSLGNLLGFSVTWKGPIAASIAEVAGKAFEKAEDNQRFLEYGFSIT
jgi:hypothetical protein